MDRVIVELDRVLRTFFDVRRTRRPIPGAHHPEPVLNSDERRRVIGMMRVNHAGEVCAQALYQGQALASRDRQLAVHLRQAAEEEVEHLAWTSMRLQELGGRVSLVQPVWYFGSLSIGLFAGLVGDRWSLGFLAETERQVGAHLQGHLDRLPAADLRSREIIAQMKVDELQHADIATFLGANELPQAVKGAMVIMARIMTRVAYRI